jgi:glycerol-3-phosphate O-acyltransferase
MLGHGADLLVRSDPENHPANDTTTLTSFHSRLPNHTETNTFQIEVLSLSVVWLQEPLRALAKQQRMQETCRNPLDQEDAFAT